MYGEVTWPHGVIVNAYFLATAFMMLSLATIIPNALAITAFLKLRYYQNVPECLLLILSIIDLLVGLITDMLFSVHHITQIMEMEDILCCSNEWSHFSLHLEFHYCHDTYELCLSLLKPFLSPRKVRSIVIYYFAFGLLVVFLSLSSIKCSILENFYICTHPWGYHCLHFYMRSSVPYLSRD